MDGTKRVKLVATRLAKKRCASFCRPLHIHFTLKFNEGRQNSPPWKRSKWPPTRSEIFQRVALPAIASHFVVPDLEASLFLKESGRNAQ